MGGRASLLLVVGFGLIFMTLSSNFNSLTLKSIEGYGGYLNEGMAYYIAVSGANMAANEIFLDRTWGTGYSNVAFNGGILNVYVNNTIAGTSGKVEICHVPPGNPGSRHTLWVPSSALSAHLAHGDYMGQCDSAVSSTIQTATIISEGTYAGITKAVVVELRPASYAKYGNFYANMTAYPATGDTFNGPFHVNTKLTTYGTPVFWGKVTTKSGLSTKGSPPSPKFYGGYATGIDIPNDFDTSGLRNNASKIFRDTTGANKNTDVRLYFNSNGTVTYSQKIGSGSFTTPKTVAITALAPNGLIYVERGNIYTKGTVNGSVTLVASKKGTTGSGQVFLEDNLAYNKDPKVYSNSTDMVGIVAESDIRIVGSSATLGKDIVTQASMYSVTGSIGPDDALVNQSYLGSWKILGGLIAANTRVTATYDWWGNPSGGLRFVHRYDDRFATAVPPFFPKTKYYEIVSWYE